MSWPVTVQPLSIWRWGAEEERWFRLTGFSQPGGAVIETFLTKAKIFYIQKAKVLTFLHVLSPSVWPLSPTFHLPLSIFINSSLNLFRGWISDPRYAWGAPFAFYRKMMILQLLLKQNVLPVQNVALRKCQYWQCKWLIFLIGLCNTDQSVTFLIADCWIGLTSFCKSGLN